MAPLGAGRRDMYALRGHRRPAGAAGGATECRPHGVAVKLETVALGPERIAESNQIRIDGELLEQLQPQISVGQNDCSSCGELLGHPQDCPTIGVGDEIHEVPPAWLIRQAVCRSAGCC
jgi:hypothetical protein